MKRPQRERTKGWALWDLGLGERLADRTAQEPRTAALCAAVLSWSFVVSLSPPECLRLKNKCYSLPKAERPGQDAVSPNKDFVLPFPVVVSQLCCGVLMESSIPAGATGDGGWAAREKPVGEKDHAGCEGSRASPRGKFLSGP